MPWTETCAMDEKVRFVSRWLEREMSMAELCRVFGVSRDIGYKWVRRYEAEGVDGLKEKSRAPLSSPNATPARGSSGGSRSAMRSSHSRRRAR